MAYDIIPVDASAPAYDIEVELGGTVYKLALAWNTRGEFWSLSVLTQQEVPIVLGVRIAADWDLLSQFADARLPAGRILAIDQSGAGLDPALDDLGTRVILVYTDE